MSLSANAKAITGAVTETVVDLIVVVVIGFFGALIPRGYEQGALSLSSPEHRQRAREIAVELIHCTDAEARSILATTPASGFREGRP